MALQSPEYCENSMYIVELHIFEDYSAIILLFQITIQPLFSTANPVCIDICPIQILLC